MDTYFYVSQGSIILCIFIFLWTRVLVSRLTQTQSCMSYMEQVLKDYPITFLEWTSNAPYMIQGVLTMPMIHSYLPFILITFMPFICCCCYHHHCCCIDIPVIMSKPSNLDQITSLNVIGLSHGRNQILKWGSSGSNWKPFSMIIPNTLSCTHAFNFYYQRRSSTWIFRCHLPSSVKKITHFPCRYPRQTQTSKIFRHPSQTKMSIILYQIYYTLMTNWYWVNLTITSMSYLRIGKGNWCSLVMSYTTWVRLLLQN